MLKGYAIVAIIGIFWYKDSRSERKIDANTAAAMNVVTALKEKIEFDKAAVKTLGVEHKLPPAVLVKQDKALDHVNKAAAQLR